MKNETHNNFPFIFFILILGLISLTRDAQTNLKTNNQNIIKAHIQRAPCSGYYVTYTRNGGGYEETTGPTGQECTTGTLGNPPQGYYKVEAYDGCHWGAQFNVYHNGYGITDVYITPSDECQERYLK